MTRDKNVIGLGLSYTRRDNTDTDFGDELDADSRTRVSTLEVIDELLQVLNGVTVKSRSREERSQKRITS